MAGDMKRRLFTTILLSGVFVVLGALPAAALRPPTINADRAAANVVVVQSGDVVKEDLYAVGYRIVIEGTVEGDVLAVSTGELLITGHVTGSVTGAASSVVISGTVDGSVRVAAGSIKVDGRIGNDLFGGASSVVVTGEVGRDLMTWNVSMDSTGTVGRNVGGQSLGTARIGGVVSGDVDMTTNRLEVLPGTTVGGTLAYRSSNEATVGQGVTAGRQIVRKDPVRPNVRVTALFTLTRVIAVLSVLLIGLLLFWAAPRSIRRSVEVARTAPIRTAIVGIAAAILPPLVIVLAVGAAVSTSAELALPALVVGGPIAVTVFGLIAVGVLLAPIPVLTAVGGRLLGNKRSEQAGFLLGAVLWLVLLLIPVVRTVVLVVTACLGLGAWTTALLAAGREQEPEPPAEEPPAFEEPELFPMLP